MIFPNKVSHFLRFKKTRGRVNVVPLDAPHAYVINNTGSRSYELYCEYERISSILEEKDISFPLLKKESITPMILWKCRAFLTRVMLLKTHKRFNFTCIIAPRNYFKLVKGFIPNVHISFSLYPYILPCDRSIYLTARVFCFMICCRISFFVLLMEYPDSRASELSRHFPLVRQAQQVCTSSVE